MTQTIVQRIALKAIIVHDNKVLVLREAKAYQEGANIGRYDYPGGRLEPGEHWEDGLRREITEETGLTVRVGRPLAVGEWHPVIRDVPHQVVGVFVVCFASTNKVTLSKDHDDAQWVSSTSRHDLDILAPHVLTAFFEDQANGRD